MDTNIVGSQLAASILVVYGLQLIKRDRMIPWVDETTKRANRWIAAVLALIAAVGIHFEFDAAAGVLTVTGLTATGLLHGAWQWFTQWAYQQAVWDGIVQPADRRRNGGT